jgi:hypothetical protein
MPWLPIWSANLPLYDTPLELLDFNVKDLGLNALVITARTASSTIIWANKNAILQEAFCSRQLLQVSNSNSQIQRHQTKSLDS